MNQLNGKCPFEYVAQAILNSTDVKKINELQRITIKESRIGIPLFVARDVIPCFKTIFPIPLEQSTSWNPFIVEKRSSVAVLKASYAYIRWTFAPMINISRDPRWGIPASGNEFLCRQILCKEWVYDGMNVSDWGSISKFFY